MAKFVCKYCGMHTPVYRQVGPHMGEWCHSCQRWIRWVPKTEFNKNDAVINTISQNKSPTQSVLDVQDLKDEVVREKLSSIHYQDYLDGLDDEVPF